MRADVSPSSAAQLASCYVSPCSGLGLCHQMRAAQSGMQVGPSVPGGCGSSEVWTIRFRDTRAI